MNGFLMLFVNAVVLILAVVGIINSIIQLDASDGHVGGWMLGGSVLLLIINIIMWCGLMMLEPNEAKVTTWFGKYSGTFSQTGFYWICPFYSTKKVSLRARNLDAEPIKVNDKTGNPVMIGLVLVWKLKDTYKALFEIDSQTMAANPKRWRTSSVCRAMQPCVRWLASMPTTMRTPRQESPHCAQVPTRSTSNWSRNSTSVWLWQASRWSRPVSTTWPTPQRLLP